METDGGGRWGDIEEDIGDMKEGEEDVAEERNRT